MTRGRYDLDAVKARVTVGDVLDALGHAPPEGRRRVPCPIHGGTGANFSVYADGRRWRCWSRCGGGDVVDLAAHMRGCSTAEAIRWCAELAGLAPGRPETAHERERRQTAARRLRALRAWRTVERMRLSGGAYRAEIETEAASATLHAAGPDDDAAWDVLAEAVRATEHADWREHCLGVADDLDLYQLWRAERAAGDDQRRDAA